MKALLPLLVSLPLAACTSTSHPDTGVQEGSVRAADGVKIVYDVRGQGDTTLLFIHCWAGDRSFWYRELERFRDRYRIVAIDLPGHGQSGDGRSTWTIKGLAEDVATVANALDLERVILIGHSMGGPIALGTAHLLQGRVIGVIGVDTLHDVDIVFPRDAADALAQGFEQDFEGTMTGAIQSMLPTDVDPEAKTWIIERAERAHRVPVIAIMRDFPNVDMKELFTNAHVPVRCINKTPLSENDVGTAVEKNRAYADFDAVIMEGVGHYPMIERPSEFDAKLELVVSALAAR